jgi:hypothetical protein
MPRKAQRVTNGHRAAVCGLVIAGVSMTEACRIAGVPREVLPKYLPAGWHDRRSSRRTRRWKGEELAGLREAYCDLNQKTATIAARYDVHVSQIYRLAHLHGWPRRLPGGARKPNSIRSMSPKQRTVYFKLRTIMPPAAAAAQACQ